ncbi:unnamed protein product, partial [Eruca vesicaria subsp. sativa]|nr:unnamed protein product [Eruca vesicaria subsp. sativa]
NREEAVKKRKDASKKKRDAAAAKKKRDAATAAAKKKDAVARKKEKEATAKKKTETAENKRVRDGGADGRSSSTRTKQSQNRETEIEVTETASPQSLQGESFRASPKNHLFRHPLQPLETSLSLSNSSTKSPSDRVVDDEEIGSNNRDSRTPEAANNNDVQRTVVDENMAVEQI